MTSTINEFVTLITALLVGGLTAIAPVWIAKINRQTKRTDLQIKDLSEAVGHTNHDTTSVGDSLDKSQEKLDKIINDQTQIKELLDVNGRDIGHARKDIELINDRITTHERAIAVNIEASANRMQSIVDRLIEIERATSKL